MTHPHVSYTCPSCGHRSSAVTTAALRAAARDHIAWHTEQERARTAEALK